MGDYVFGLAVGFVVALLVVNNACEEPSNKVRRCIYECAHENMAVVECSRDYAVCGAHGARRLRQWSAE